MALEYALFENNLTTDPNDYVAIPQNAVTKNLEDIIEMATGKGSTVTKAEALAFMEEFGYAIESLLKDGNSINTPLFKLNVRITGVFNGLNDSYDSNRHAVKVYANAGSRFKDINKKIDLKKVTASRPMPLIQDFKDVISNTHNDVLSPGGVGQLTGSRLKIDDTDPTQGIFLVAALGGSETKITTLVRNKPADIIFTIPTGLAKGEYSLEVRIKLQNTKELRIATIDDTLTVL